MSTKVKLLPCPFCGQPAHEEYDPTVSNMFEIGCPDNWKSKGTCNVGPAAIGATYEEAVEAWNRRVLIQPETEDPSFAEALSDSQVRIWITTCNHEPARQALRQLLAYRVRGVTKPLGASS